MTDFCGSPGFFCPEMITHGIYYGDKADVWSISGIMLELILGNERFTNYWMGAYEYEVMQNKDKFIKEITNVTKKLPDRLPFSGDLKDFILQFPRINPKDRPACKDLLTHPWVAAAVVKMQNAKVG